MKKSIADKWIKALRSGKYKQTANVLCDDKGFCCLGVLCEISKLDEFIEFDPGKSLRPDQPKYHLTYLDAESYLPIDVMEWSGIKNPFGIIQSINMSLSQLNDGTLLDSGEIKLNFDEIADIIQINWEEL